MKNLLIAFFIAVSSFGNGQQPVSTTFHFYEGSTYLNEYAMTDVQYKTGLANYVETSIETHIEQNVWDRIDTIGYYEISNSGVFQGIRWTTYNGVSARFHKNNTEIVFTLEVDFDGVRHGAKIKITNKPNASINKINETIFSIFPNPTTDYININTDEYDINTTIINQNGNIVLQSTTKQIDVQQLPQGLYFIKINNTIHKISKN